MSKKKTPSGWLSFNAPCCIHNGENADRRKRGGIMNSPDGTLSFHCFNCGFKTSYTPGRKISLKTKGGILQAESKGDNLVKINMGQPNFDWKKIPLSKEIDNKNLKIKIKSLDGKEILGGFSLSIGNPHVVFFVEDCGQFNLNKIGPAIENHSYFPEKCNVTLATVKNKKHIIVKVWERGAGLTKACGTAACATAVSGASLKFTERCVDIEFPEGLLNIDWNMNNNIYMTGKVSSVKKITVNI